MQTIDHLAQLAGIFLVSGIWQGFVLAAGVWLCLRLVPRTSAALRFTIWAVVMAVVALLPFVEGPLRVHSSASNNAPQAFQIDARWSLAIIALWVAFSLYRAIDLAIHALHLRAMLKRSTPVEDANCLPLLSIGHRAVQLCTSAEVDRPSVMGFFAPRILIPAALFEQLTTAELKQIILHEVEHLRRRDDWLNLLQKLSLVFFPLNPILIWVERRLCLERELACDDGVLRRTRAPRAYALCLTNLAERGLHRRTLSLALGALGISGAAHQSELARRVHRILSREATLSPLAAWAVTIVVAMGLAGGAASLAHCPQLISFVAAPPQQYGASLPSMPPRLGSTAFQNVVYRETPQPHASLLQTSFQRPARVVPAGSKPAAVRKHRRALRPTAKRVDQLRASLPRMNDDAWVVLTSWSEADRPRLVLPVINSQTGQTPSAPRYAAVPTLGGWLIIQL